MTTNFIDRKEKTSELLKLLLCDPEGNISIQGSDKDKELLQIAIKEVEGLEKLEDGLSALTALLETLWNIFRFFPMNQVYIDMVKSVSVLKNQINGDYNNFLNSFSNK